MTTNSNANGVAMIEFLVFVALHAAKVSSISVFLHVRLSFYLHHHVARYVFDAKVISVALSYHSIKGVSKPARRLTLTKKTEEQDAWVRHSKVRSEVDGKSCILSHYLTRCF